MIDAQRPAAGRAGRSCIGIFDSGVGGLTVQKAIFERVPGLETVYLGATARVPYGSRSPEVVTQYALRAARFLAAREIELLVVACNTVSAVALPALRDALHVPVLGVVEPGARAALRASRGGRIGVIGTPSTVASGAYQRALAALRPGVEVVARACPLFVPLAEEGWTEPDDEVVAAVARRYLAPLAEARVDTLVLGCTHYPLLRAQIERLVPHLKVIDSACVTAEQVALAINGKKISGSGARHFFATDSVEKFRKMGTRFLGEPMNAVQIVDLGS
jgi:glutamate racemase